ncbi:MAG TPA: M13 family metallopeptidase N-terminal domain-containing protein, partial [Gemmatimonadales bacterium]|nr:M13 family metallopeptidase N-terminal domain-containing protein [Gemmatimonadales bacterium]
MSHVRPERRVGPALLLVLSLTATALAAQGALKPLKVVDRLWIDTTANACSDFFQYANGAWIAHDTIPAAYSSSGVARDMSDRNELVVRSVLDDAAAHRASQPAGSTPRKLGTFYASCMDSTAAEAAGIDPIRPWLAGIDSIATRDQLIPQIAALQVRGVNVAFRYGPEADPHDAAHYLVWLAQGGLGLPDRDYYTKT